LAAQRSNGSLSFVIVVAGPAQDFQNQTNDEIQNVVREEGLGEDAAQRALAYQDLWWRVYRKQALYPELAALSEQSKSNAWYRYTFGAKSTIDPPGAYDPSVVLRNLHVPVLAIYGESDNRVLGDKNARLMRRALNDGRNLKSTVKVFPSANHDIIVVPNTGNESYLQSARYAKGYLDYLVNWIARQSARR